MPEEQVVRFTSWGSRVAGGLGLALVAFVVLLGVAGVGGSYDPAAYPVCGLAALLIWVMLLRPEVAVQDDRLVLRNPLTTVRIPLAAVEQVVVRQWLAVRAGDRQFTSTAVGRSFRQTMRDDRTGAATGIELTKLSYGAIVERRIAKLAEDARWKQGVEQYSDEQQALASGVRREPARVELSLACVLALALVVTLLG